MALSTSNRDLGIGFSLLLLLMARDALVMERQFEIQLLLIRGELLFALDGGLGVALLALLYSIAFLPYILAIFVDVMALGTGDFVVLIMLLVGKRHIFLGRRRPNGPTFELDHILPFIRSDGQQSSDSNDESYQD